MILPLLLSLPHAGSLVPALVEHLCLLREKEIVDDSDGGADEIYLPLEEEVAALVTTVVARAIVDMNRDASDRSKDGCIKTHTCWNVPIYRDPLSEAVITELLEVYYHPYHTSLSEQAAFARCGIDCHTMAAKGPPVGPDAGKERPAICISNGDGTCPKEWMTALASCLERVFEKEVFINWPFKGGFIIRSHSRELPWIQLELSRAPFLSNQEKRFCLLSALRDWCVKTLLC